MSADALDTFEGIEEPRAPADVLVESGVAVCENVQTRPLLVVEDAGDGVQILFTEDGIGASATLNGRP